MENKSDSQAAINRLFYLVLVDDGDSFRVRDGVVMVAMETAEAFLLTDISLSIWSVDKKSLNRVLPHPKEFYVFSETETEARKVLKEWLVSNQNKYASGLIALENAKNFSAFAK